MRWPLRSYDGGSQAQLTHNDRDKRGHEAHDLEASRIFSFSHLPRVPLFSFYDRAIQVRNTYGPRAISGGTAYGQQGIGGASKVLLMDKGESTVLSLFMKY